MWRRKVRAESPPVDDSQLLELFSRDAKKAWDLFVERYADTIFGQLRGMGFDYDDAMDRFVYVCEKLSENDCRRMRSIRFAGQHGELVPWVRTVVKNLCVNWAWSKDGRKRLFKVIEELPALERRVFELYFWRGLTPAEVEQQLKREAVFEVEGTEVFDALERVISSLSANRLWRLASGLLRARRSPSFEELSEIAGVKIEAVANDPTPEQETIRRAESSWLSESLETLDPQPRLVIQMRFEQSLTLAKIGRALGLPPGEVRSLLASSIEELRSLVPHAPRDLSVEGDQ